MDIMTSSIDIVRYWIIENVDLIIVIAFFVFSFLVILKLSPVFRKSVSKISRLFLYEDSSQNYDIVIDVVNELDKRMAALEKNIDDKFFKDKTSKINEEIDKFITANLKSELQAKIKDKDIISNTVVGDLKATVVNEITRYLNAMEIEELHKEKHIQMKYERMEASYERLERTIEQERASSATLKTVMINLFVIFNLGILLTYLIWGSNIGQHAIYAITGLYLSLATFIFYIIRTSHFRTSVLLALREDTKKQGDVFEFLSGRNGKDLSENDVELLKMILTNRAEREQKSDHPYEVVLKGVSGSNIQFKGGKINLGKQKE